MLRKRGRSSLLRRLEELEARSTDSSRLVPHSPEWLQFWLKQFHLYDTGQPYVTFTVEAIRAIMRATPDEDESIEESMVVAPPTESQQGRRPEMNAFPNDDVRPAAPGNSYR